MTRSAKEDHLLFFPDLEFGKTKKQSVVVLVSGGIESVFLLSSLTPYFAFVYPVYVCFGLHWEKAEYQSLLRYLDAIKQPEIQPVTRLNLSVDDIYGSHWSTTGTGVPDAESEDAAVYLPGRNLLLIAKTAVWCNLHKIDYLALGCLESNPFPDARAEFFDHLEAALTAGFSTSVKILRPLSKMHKHNVVQLAKDLPLHLTFSCINPTAADNPIHCGVCNKCAERQNGFALAQVKDETVYASYWQAMQPVTS